MILTEIRSPKPKKYWIQQESKQILSKEGLPLDYQRMISTKMAIVMILNQVFFKGDLKIGLKSTLNLVKIGIVLVLE